ncbi:MAG: hypothetical protein ACO28V_08870 [Chitinophagaceae bacterium]
MKNLSNLSGLDGCSVKKYFVLFIISFTLSFTSQAQTGLFMRTQYWGNQLEISWLFFTNDKKVIRNPKFGADPLNIQKEMSQNSNNVATITQLSGGKMSLTWGDGRKQTINVEFKNGILSAFDGGLCSKATPFAFKFFQDKKYSGLASYGNVTRSVTMFLGKDGKFSTERLGSVSGSGNFSGAAAATGTDSGTYSIKGNTIIFKYNNGTEWIAVAQPYDLGKQDIIINDQRFKVE